MAKKDDAVEQTVTLSRKKLVAVGWIAGGVLAFGATFAAGAAIGHVADGPRGNGDFAAGQLPGPGHFGPQSGPGMGDGDGEYSDGQSENGPGDNDSDRPGHGMGGMMAPPAPTAPNSGSITPEPMTSP